MYLSIIIPIYNVEKYIGDCLDSIYSQNFPEERYEVVCVNDGTPDNSMDIVKQYACKHENLKIVNQENQGLSVARNNGFEASSGDNIWWVDSDDWLQKNALQTVWNALETYPDIEVFATIMMMNYEVTGNVEQEFPHNPNVKSGRDYLFRNFGRNCGACQRYIFRRSFLEKHKLRYMPNVYHEDGDFSNRMLYLAERLIILPTPVYNYRIGRSGSIMTNRKMKMNYDLVKIYWALQDFAEKYVRGNDDYWQFRVKAFNCLACTVFFSQKQIFTKEYDVFYQENKSLIKKEARKILPHIFSLTRGQAKMILQFSFFPKLKTQIRYFLKKS